MQPGTTRKFKKPKTSESTGPIDQNIDHLNSQSDEDQWTTVGHKSKVASTIPARPNVAAPNAFACLMQADDKQSTNGEQWTKVEKRKAKKARKAEEKAELSPPRFFYVNSAIVKRREAVTIGDIRDLVLHLLGEAAPQPWLKVENRQAIEKVVVLFVPGILPEHLNVHVQSTNATSNPNLPLSIPLPPDSSPPLQANPVIVKTLFGGTKEITPDMKNTGGPKLPFVARTFSHVCPTRAPGDSFRMHSVLSAFFQGPISAEEKKRRIAAALKAGRNFATDDPTRYVLSPSQMLENEYPLPTYMKEASGGVDSSSSALEDGWLETPKPEENGIGLAEIFSVDCEMCLTEDGKELTRVCVIDFKSGKVLLDRLVKPPRPVVDYLTRWSGINEESLRNTTATLEIVRDELLGLLSASRSRTGKTPILLGHSLESDLGALKLAHSRCIDTALLYHHPRGRPLKPGLAWLTKKWCGREIQDRGEGGHDAEEDARACVELLQRKLEGGPSFGEYRSTTEFESIFERLRRSIRGSLSGEPGTGSGAKLRTAVIDRGNPATWHGAGAGRCIGCSNDEEITQGILQCMEDSDFIWARLSGLAEALNWLQPKITADNPGQNPPEADRIALGNALKTLNSHLSIIHATLPPRTAFIVFTGHSDPRPMGALQARKNAFENAVRASQGSSNPALSTVKVPEGVRWTNADARDLEEIVERARRGMLFLCLK